MIVLPNRLVTLETNNSTIRKALLKVLNKTHQNDKQKFTAIALAITLGLFTGYIFNFQRLI